MAEEKPKPVVFPCVKCGRELANQDTCMGGPQGADEHVHCPRCKFINNVKEK